MEQSRRRDEAAERVGVVAVDMRLVARQPVVRRARGLERLVVAAKGEGVQFVAVIARTVLFDLQRARELAARDDGGGLLPADQRSR